MRDKKLAVAVGGSAQAFEKVTMAEIATTVAKGIEPAAVEARIDAVLAEFLASGPTADEVSRVVTRNVAGTIRGLEAVGGFGGKAVALAEGAVYAGDPNFYKKELAAYAAATPASVLAAARLWLANTDYRLTVLPGKRPEAENAAPRSATPPAPATPVAMVTRPAAPPLGGSPTLVVAPVERATLANGLKIELARRDTIPVVQILLSFDGGYGADDRTRLGIQNLALGLLDEGAAGMTGPQIAESRERLGAVIGAGADADRTRISLNALKPNLGGSLALFADIVQRPTFDPAELNRVRGQVLTGIAQEEADPGSISRRLLPVLLYGDAHPYGVPGTGSGTVAGVSAVTRDDLVAWHKRWIRPDNGTIFVVGDITMPELKPQLEASFGGWQPDAATAKGARPSRRSSRRASARDHPHRPPGQPAKLYPRRRRAADQGQRRSDRLAAANDILGGLFSSRLNIDIREAKRAGPMACGRASAMSAIVVTLQDHRTGAGRSHRQFDGGDDRRCEGADRRQADRHGRARQQHRQQRAVVAG